MDENWRGTVRVDRPVAEVYRYLADFPKHCEWAQTLDRMERVEPGDARGVGARYLTYERQRFQSDRKPREPLTRGFAGKTMCYVDELVPDRRIAWHAHPVPRLPVRAECAFELAPAADGRGTVVTQTIRMHQNPLLMRVFGLLMGASPEKAHAQWNASLQNVKTVLESEAPAP
jgi:uncharacterized membrane protein